MTTVEPQPAPATRLELGYDKKLMLFSGRANPDLGARIAAKLGISPGPVTLKTFTNGGTPGASNDNDADPPTADIVDVTPDPRRFGVNTITIVFNEAVTGFERDHASGGLDRLGRKRALGLRAAGREAGFVDAVEVRDVVRYEAAITTIHEAGSDLVIIIREVFTHPANFGKVSFPMTTAGGGGVRPYMKGSALRYDDDDEQEEVDEDSEEVEELDTTLPEYSGEPELEEELVEEP